MEQSKIPYSVYKKVQGSIVVFIFLYINDILLMGDDIRLFLFVKI